MKGIGGNFAQSGAGMIAFGTVFGGAGAALTGGIFWQGALTGLVVSGLNHAMHLMDDNGYDKNGKQINNNGGDTTDYRYDDNGNVIESTNVKFIGGISQGKFRELGGFRGYGFKGMPMATGAITEDNTIAIFFIGGTAIKGVSNVFSGAAISNKKIGIGSKLFGNSVVSKGLLNVNGKAFKMGWSTFQNSEGAWGYEIRIGIGVSKNPNIALRHLYIRSTWTANEIANPIIKTLR